MLIAVMHHYFKIFSRKLQCPGQLGAGFRRFVVHSQNETDTTWERKLQEAHLHYEGECFANPAAY